MRLRRALALLLLAPAIAGASSASGAGGPAPAQAAAPGPVQTSADAPDDSHHDHDHHHAHDQEAGMAQGGQPAGHEHDEGLALQPATGETVATTESHCADDAEVRRYDIVALALDITLNRYGDHDRDGRMYALAEEVDAAVAASRDGVDAVSVGLQGDAVQPLVLRVRPGECLLVTLENRLEEEPASFHLHSSSLTVAATGEAATEANPDAMAAPGETVSYEWAVPAAEPEGTHVFHSHGDARFQSGHGLFGTLVVEPAGATWSDPRTGREGTTKWDAVVTSPDGTFREFVLAYHEIGHEDYRVAAAGGGTVPQVDPFTKAYRPAARALNYRSEPFMNRLQAQADRGMPIDESLAYSSYSFGDPATPILRTYVGDPVKERVVHAGAEVFHVHHVHGGSVRWRRQPGAGRTGFGGGLTKEPELTPDASERVDSASIGPSEAFDVDHECSAGGCQQGAGDYLVHCHIAHHYFAGMWGIWRVYNTLQDGPASTDAMAPLPALPDRTAAVAPGVPSSQLEPEAAAAARGYLPPPGVPPPGDATLWDWTEEGGDLVGEPETTERWPGYASPAPGRRPTLLFDPASGRPAYPMLRPHLAERPPFAARHGPAPYLDVPSAGHDPPPPGAGGDASLCPAGTEVRPLHVRAIEVPVPINADAGLVDPAGAVFVLAEDEAAVRADPSRRQPLAIRANAQEHCVDVLLTNEMPDNGNHPFSKISAHIHFVQFDVQAGDGVSTGFNFEQTVRPITEGGSVMAEDAPAGATSVAVADAARLPPGAEIGFGLDGADTIEIRRVVSTAGGRLELDAPLDHPHRTGEVVTTEFVRYRWYPDAQVGTAYFHDHVNGIQTWQHGLVGALVVEPPGATYHDPRTGQAITSGPVADVRVPPGTPVSADIAGSFRELVSFMQDGSRLSHVGRSPGSNLNLRAEPLARRPGPRDRAFASALHGDPLTPMLEAFVGDPLVVRATVSGTNEVHTWHVDGHWFRLEPWSLDSAPRTTVRIGISERQDVMIPAAGGPQRRPGDYLYGNGRALKLEEGAWGLLRVHAAPTPADDLQPLPGHDISAADDPPPLCPDQAPVRRFAVAAVEAALPMLGPRRGRVFVVAADADAVAAGEVEPTPLVLRAAVGDCLEVTLENRLPAGSPPVSLHADGLAYDPLRSGGVEAGRNPSQVVEPGDQRTSTFYAHPEYGPIAALLRDGADLAASGGLGMYGAVVVGPEGATFEPATGWSAIGTAPGRPSWRDVVLFMHDEDDAIGTHRMPYTTTVRGAVGLNYRNDAGIEVAAYGGDPLDLHVLAPWSEQAQVFALEGHRWPLEPAMEGSTLLGSTGIGGLESLRVVPVGGAGGDLGLAGTYRFGDHREPFREAGLSGHLVVHPACGPDVPGLARLAGREDPCGGGGDTPAFALAGGGAGVLLLAAAGAFALRRRRSGVPTRR